MAPCGIQGGCKHPELVGSHVCRYCDVSVHNFCRQELDGDEDAPEGGFTCGRNGTCARASTDPGAGGAMGDAETYASGTHCAQESGSALSCKKPCCGKPCHLMCMSLPYDLCDVPDYEAGDHRYQEEEEEEEEEEEDSNTTAGSAKGKEKVASSIDVTGEEPEVQPSAQPFVQPSAQQGKVQNPYANLAGGNAKTTDQAALVSGAPLTRSSGGFEGSGLKRRGRGQGTAGKAKPRKNSVPTPVATRESNRLRAQAAQLEKEVVDINHSCEMTKEMDKTIKVCMHDAVIGLVGCQEFTVALSSVVTSKTFESSVEEVSKKTTVSRTQLKKVVDENKASVAQILEAALVPVVEEAIEGLSEGCKAFETGKKAFIAAASNDADAKKGGRRGKPARGGKAGALDAPEKTGIVLSDEQRDLVATAISAKISGNVADLVCERFVTQLGPKLGASITTASEDVKRSVGREIEDARRGLSHDIQQLRGDMVKEIKQVLLKGGMLKKRGKRAAASSSSSSSDSSSDSGSCSSPEAKKKKKKKKHKTPGKSSRRSSSSRCLSDINSNTHHPFQHGRMQQGLHPPATLPPPPYQAPYSGHVGTAAPTQPPLPPPLVILGSPVAPPFNPFAPAHF